MEKFKFVDLGKFGVLPSIACNGNELICGDGEEIQLHIVDRNGLLAITSPNPDCAGDIDDASEYDNFAHHIFVGDSRNDLVIALRSLADELEKTLGGE